MTIAKDDLIDAFPLDAAYRRETWPQGDKAPDSGFAQP